MAKYYDAAGGIQEVPLTLEVYKEAEAKGLSVEAYINSQHPTAEGDASAFDQMVASLGISMRSDPKAGVHASRLSDVLDGTTMSASANTREGAPESRIIFPAAILSAVEDKLQRDLTETATAYDRMVAYTDTIPNKQFTRVITNFDKPEEARNSRTAQLARPQNFMLMTASERPGVVPTTSLGLEWSDEVAEGTTIDFVALSVARQVAIQANEDAKADLLALVNGDEDIPQAALPAGYRTKAAVLDPVGAPAPGKLTQAAWVKWLHNGSSYRRIDWIVTDIETALAIENREGKPVIVGDDPNSPRIDSTIQVANPSIPASVKVFVTDHPNWDANTILGLDSRYAIQRVISLSANYSDTERDVMRRANAMRWDSGSISYRMYDEAFSLLALTA